MKKAFLLLFATSLFFACSRKTVPPKGNNATIVNGNSTTIDNNNVSNNTTNNNAAPVNADTATAAVRNVNTLSFIVVSDAYGKIVTPQDSLPADASVQFNQFELSKGFTAQKLINLKTRYKTIPPRVLYVNPQKQISSPRGTYYVLGKKFWYWKKKDGFFYLDDKYYL